MADNRKYYYLKLKEDFFDTDEMKILESMKDGYLYSNILLKLYLKSLSNSGRLMYRNVIPYTPEKGEAIFPLTQEQINQIAAIGAKEGVRAYKEEQKKEERRRKKEDSKVRKTKKLLSSYRRIKATLSDDEQFTPEEQAELRWKFIEDLMGNTREIAGKSERTIKDTERKREEDLYCVFRIEKATEMYREECEKSGSEEAKRRYRELSMMYLDEKPYTVQEISEVENISDKTVYKDIGIACGIVAIYLLGADF